MAFIGAAIRAVTGGIQKLNNVSIINELEEELEKDLLEDFSEEERVNAQIKLKQASLELAQIKGRKRKITSAIEKEIIGLMEQSIKIKVERLKQKEATQLDIANTMIAIQKTNNDLRDYIDGMEEDIKGQALNNKKKIALLWNKQDEINKEIDFQKKELNIIQEQIKTMEERIDQNDLQIDMLNENASKQKFVNFFVYLIALFGVVLGCKLFIL